MAWEVEIRQEFSRAHAAESVGNAGKVRTCARRAAGIAIIELQRFAPERSYGTDYLRCLRAFSEDPTIPAEPRECARRLQHPLNSDFTSEAKRPIEDAQTIVDFVRSCLHMPQ